MLTVFVNQSADDDEEYRNPLGSCVWRATFDFIDESFDVYQCSRLLQIINAINGLPIRVEMIRGDWFRCQLIIQQKHDGSLCIKRLDLLHFSNLASEWFAGMRRSLLVLTQSTANVCFCEPLNFDFGQHLVDIDAIRETGGLMDRCRGSEREKILIKNQSVLGICPF